MFWPCFDLDHKSRWMGKNIPVMGSTAAQVESYLFEQVSLTLGDAPHQVTLVGEAHDLHRLIIEADRQLSRITRHQAGRSARVYETD